MDIGKAFTFVGDDPQWVNKVLIGGGLVLAGTVLSVTLIGGIIVFAIVYGYMMQLTRNVVEGRRQPLPEWDNWGVLMRDGLKYTAVNLIVTLPVLVLFMLLFIPGIALSSNQESGAVALGTGLMIGAYCLLLPLLLLASLFAPVIYTRLALAGSIGESLRLREVFATVRANFTDYLIVLLIGSFVVGLIAQLGLIACLVGVFFTTFYALLINHHLHGQVYRKAQGLPPGVAPPPPAYPPAPSYPY